jgi:hypothetical protein
MSNSDDVFKRALVKLLAEICDSAPANESYVLNPGEPGLVRQLETIDARTASTRTIPGRTTIAGHVDHVHYGLSLLNRWAAGETNPWATADWEGSWKRGVVTDEQWRTLRDRLRQATEDWRKAVTARSEWDDVMAAGAIASAAHTAYHLGAIRQILAGIGK